MNNVGDLCGRGAPHAPRAHGARGGHGGRAEYPHCCCSIGWLIKPIFSGRK